MATIHMRVSNSAPAAPLPVVQNYLPGNMDNVAYPIVAVDSKLEFRSICE